ncbi:MAG: (d)CMP kinase [Bacillota bacterium]|nr:(d)CMP kinase [Bacillota bacterium]
MNANLNMSSAAWVAIDGPAGAGKTTVARLVARRLGYLYVDTGAMYRAITLKVLRLGTPLCSQSLRDLLRATDVRLLMPEDQSESRVFLDNQDVTAEIRSTWINRWVSPVSARSEVRQKMQRLQRQLAALGGVVMEGRDIGTAVLPAAGTKVFLTAARRDRVYRRTKELRAAGRRTSALQQFLAMGRRDRIDRRRADSPLRVAPDATVIDSTLLTADEVCECVIALHMFRHGGRSLQ